MNIEPNTAAATGFAVSKIYYAVAGLFGGAALAFFWTPAKLSKHGRMAAGAIVGGVSVGSAVIFGGALAVFFGMNPNDANTALAMGGGVGVSSVAIISLLANFFEKRENKDLLEVVKEVSGK
jgi:Kef-type K+ transport system membrane component KefB